MSDPQPSNYSSDSSWQAPSPAGYPESAPTPAYQPAEQPAYPATSAPPVTSPATVDPTSVDPALAIMATPGAAGYPATGYPAAGYPGAGYPTGYPGAGYPVAGYPVAAPPPTNGMSIAALVVAVVGMLGICAYGLGGYLGIVGAILGHVARKQIRERGDAGDGLALAGIIVGWIAGGIAILATIGLTILFVFLANQDPSYNY